MAARRYLDKDELIPCTYTSVEGEVCGALYPRRDMAATRGRVDGKRSFATCMRCLNDPMKCDSDFGGGCVTRDDSIDAVDAVDLFGHGPRFRESPPVSETDTETTLPMRKVPVRKPIKKRSVIRKRPSSAVPPKQGKK